jgi:hypothetical protein
MLRSAHVFFYHAERLPAGPEGGEFMMVTSPETFPWSLLPEIAPRETYRARFALGHRALLRVVDSVLAFRCWLAAGSLRVDELAFDWSIPEGDLCVYDVVTEPDFRGIGLYPAALTWVRANASAQSRVWVYCEATNTASRRGIGKAAYSCAGSMRALVAGRTAIVRTGRIAGVTR